MNTKTFKTFEVWAKYLIDGKSERIATYFEESTARHVVNARFAASGWLTAHYEIKEGDTYALDAKATYAKYPEAVEVA